MQLMGFKSRCAWDGGRTKTARDYVQDGLVAMWDGIENAGYGVHDASASSWVDLIGGNNFALSSGRYTWSRDAIVTNANSAKFVGVANSLSYDSVAYIESVILIPSGTLANNNQIVFSLTNDLAAYVGNIIRTQNYIETHYAKMVTMPARGVRFSFQQARVGSVNIINGTSAEAINGNKTSVNDARGYSAYIGGCLNQGTACEICAIRVYSSIPSANERAANYAIDRARFGIGGAA